MTQAKNTTGPWITSVVFNDDGPPTYAVHKKATAPDLVADYISDERTALLIAAAPRLLVALEYAYEILGKIHDGETVSEEVIGSTLRPAADAIEEATGEP